ncbi:MAG: hypothetical protein WC756_11100 [Taibaiella sp.]|jgi:hypothetical protein
MNFTDKKIPDKRAIGMLSKNGIQVDEEEAAIILEFLYLVSKNHPKTKEEKDVETLERNRTSGKTL